jgi:glycosyltransferase involved in cell wall biosynthesis
MRVAIVAAAAPARNAIGNLITEKVDFFVDRGAEVKVLLESTRHLHPRLQLHAIEIRPPALDGPVWEDLLACDLVFFEYTQGFALLGWLPLLAVQRPRLVVNYYGVTPPDGWPAPQRQLLEDGKRNRGLAWFADAVVTLSQFSRDELTQATGVPAERIRVQRIPLDLGQSKSAPPSAPPSDRPVLLFVGRLAPNKRLPLAIHALASIPEAQLWVVGDTKDVYSEEARKCRAMAKEWGVAERVRWCGEVDDLPALYRLADVLVMPSVHEGLGIPVLEAQACGVPVVAARATALPETVGDAGLLFEPDDLDDFVLRLREALTPAVAAECRQRGLARTRQWSRSRWREDFGAFVEQFLEGPPRPFLRSVELRPLSAPAATSRTRSLLVPLEVENNGDVPTIPDGPAATRIRVTLLDAMTREQQFPPARVPLRKMILPSRREGISIPIAVPARAGAYVVSLVVEDHFQRSMSPAIEIPLEVADGEDDALSMLLRFASDAIADAEKSQTLPTDYLDVTEGRFARMKRWLKQKLLFNFKHGYVDVISRQQSEVNRRLVEAVRQLAECCRSLDRTVCALEARVDEPHEVVEQDASAHS